MSLGSETNTSFFASVHAGIGYEAVEAMGHDLSSSPEASRHLAEELGDVLLQVVLNAQVAKDTTHFTIEDVIRGINDKMRRRHPHVFASGLLSREAITEESIRIHWQNEKEREGKGAFPASKLGEQLATVSKSFPATIQAQKIGRLAEKVDFDWETPAQVLKQLQEEVGEVAQAMEESEKKTGAPLCQENLAPFHSENAKIAEEIGDVYFTLAQLCRHLGYDSEVVASMGNKKFSRRFRKMEEFARDEGRSFGDLSSGDRERLWAQVKATEHLQPSFDGGPGHE